MPLFSKEFSPIASTVTPPIVLGIITSLGQSGKSASLFSLSLYWMIVLAGGWLEALKVKHASGVASAVSVHAPVFIEPF
jgi:hypothetical protein